MRPVVVDASVWVAALDPKDSFHEESRDFLRRLVRERTPVMVPSLARLEVACAVARKLRDGAKARRLAEAGFEAVSAAVVPLDDLLMAEALDVGTRLLLRGADSVYAAVAERVGADLVSWDEEHRTRAGARAPEG